MGEMLTERELWESGDENMRRVLARLARTRNSAQNHAAELERVEAERDQLRQQVERLLSAADDLKGLGEYVGSRPGDPLDRLYSVADQVRKEPGE